MLSCLVAPRSNGTESLGDPYASQVWEVSGALEPWRMTRVAGELCNEISEIVCVSIIQRGELLNFRGIYIYLMIQKVHLNKAWKHRLFCHWAKPANLQEFHLRESQTSVTHLQKLDKNEKNMEKTCREGPVVRTPTPQTAEKAPPKRSGAVLKWQLGRLVDASHGYVPR